MQVRVEKFCALATSPSWQAWLFQHNADLYRRFIKQLQESRGCGQNKDIMIETLQTIEHNGGSEELFSFLSKNYPYILVTDAPIKPMPVRTDEVFEHYNPNILTYPHRMILVGEDLQRRVQSFLIDKIKSDSVIVGNKAYIEFLNRDEGELAGMIPAKNWAISQWRLKNK